MQRSDNLPVQSFFIFTVNNPLRRAAIKFITWKWFERLSICMIILNCVALGLTDPCDVKCRKPLCRVLEVVETVIFLFFAVEMLIKMLAMGVFGKGAYFADTWNRFDCFIVAIGTAEYAFSSQEINLSAIRAIRVLRPLRAINRISSLRILVTLMLDIMPMLGNVMIFCFFIFFVFGIVAVQLWAGMLRHRCFFPENITTSDNPMQPPPFMPPYYRQPHREYVCSPAMGTLQCSSIPNFERHGSMCADLFGNDEGKMTLCIRWVANYTDCRPEGPNPARGTINFDNIGYAWIAIFQVISLESWTEVMYLVQDSFSFWVWIFFILLVLVGSYLAVNLCLVVIATQFSETKRRENERMKRERLTRMGSQHSVVSDLSEKGLYAQILELIYHYCRLIAVKVCRRKFETPHLQALVVPIRLETRTECPMCRHDMKVCVDGQRTHRQCAACGYNPRGLLAKPAVEKPERRVFRFIKKSRIWLRQLLEHDACVAAVMGTIVLNAVVMAIEHHNQPEKLTIFIETMNLIFTVIFVVELIVKLYAYGLDNFVKEAFNVLDAAVIIVNIAEILFSDHDHGGSSGFAVLRLFRLVRIVKIIRFLPALQKQLLVMFAVVDHVATFFLLLGFFLFISSLLGMSLFGCKFCEAAVKPQADNFTNEDICLFEVIPLAPSENDSAKPKGAVSSTDSSEEEVYYGCSIVNFDSPFQSLFTVLQVFTQDEWGSVMQDGMHFTSQWAGIYFVALVTIGNYIIFNLLVGILVEGFSSKSDDREGCQRDAVEMIRRRTMPRSFDVEAQDSLERGQSQDKDDRPLSERLRKLVTSCWNAEVSDRSLFIFPKDSTLRKTIRLFIKSTQYDKAFLLVIIGSCSLIVIERPGIARDSIERRLITLANYTFTAIFIMEAMTKIIAYGFCFGRRAYLRSIWNALDFFLIIIACLDIALEFTDATNSNRSALHALRVLRLLRALRPLRIISRSKGLQVVIQTLMISIKPIGNIVLICCFFFMIFAILGVQLFRGCYARCLAPKVAPLSGNSSTSPGIESYSEWAMDLISQVQTKNDCLTLGLQWETDSYNFNSLPEALMALFVFATLDGWTDITRNGVDCVGVDRQPVRDYNMWAYGYFISFLLIVCFFALNMFVGVVVNNFQNVQRQVAAQIARASQASISNASNHNVALSLPNVHHNIQKAEESEPAIPDLSKYSKVRLGLYNMVTHKFFEYVVLGATVANVILMAVEFYNMPRLFQSIVTVASNVFSVLLAIEVVLKLLAFGPRLYIANRWNQIDVFIVGLSLLGVILEELPKDLVRVNPSIVTFPRVFRIVRILKLLKSASGVRQLLETLNEAVPQVFNLSILFSLLFFIYASLGVELYGRFDCTYEVCEGLSRHANFQNFGMSLLTLFRIFTGDNWNGILKDVLWMSNDPSECFPEVDSNGQEIGGIDCSVINLVSPVYFVSFVLLAQFVLINVVVAVLMSQLEDAHTREVGRKVSKENAENCKRQSKMTGIEELIVEEVVEDRGLVYGSNGSIRGSSIDFSEDEPIVNAINIVDIAEADAVSVSSTDYILQHQDICDAEYLALKLRSLTLDSDSAVVSDITMSPLASPSGSPVRIYYRINGNNHMPRSLHSSFERRQQFALKSPRSSLDSINERVKNSVTFSRNIVAPIPSSIDTRRSRFASKLPVLPESPGSFKEQSSL